MHPCTNILIPQTKKFRRPTCWIETNVIRRKSSQRTLIYKFNFRLQFYVVLVPSEWIPSSQDWPRSKSDLNLQNSIFEKKKKKKWIIKKKPIKNKNAILIWHVTQKLSKMYACSCGILGMLMIQRSMHNLKNNWVEKPHHVGNNLHRLHYWQPHTDQVHSREL